MQLFPLRMPFPLSFLPLHSLLSLSYSPSPFVSLALPFYRAAWNADAV